MTHTHPCTIGSRESTAGSKRDLSRVPSAGTCPGSCHSPSAHDNFPGLFFIFFISISTTILSATSTIFASLHRNRHPLRERQPFALPSSKMYTSTLISTPRLSLSLSFNPGSNKPNKDHISNKGNPQFTFNFRYAPTLRPVFEVAIIHLSCSPLLRPTQLIPSCYQRPSLKCKQL